MRTLVLLLLLPACGTQAPPPPVQAVREGFISAVVAPSAEIAGRPELASGDGLDERLFTYTRASFEEHLASWAVFEKLEGRREAWAEVVGLIRDAGLPEVLAAVPYVETTLDASVVSRFCATGPWQFMPEPASRLGLRVEGCELAGQAERWQPTSPAPPSPIRTAPYIDDSGCRILRCEVDERRDLRASTLAAISGFREAWDDPVLRASGAIVPMTLVTHNGGYDDSRFGKRKTFNVKPAFERWSAGRPPSEHHLFIGDSIRTPSPAAPNFGGSNLAQETQHYGYTAIAIHLVATCYYRKNPGDDPRLMAYAGASWCDAFQIPTAAQVLARR